MQADASSMVAEGPARLKRVKQRRARSAPIWVIRLALGLLALTLIGSALSIGAVHPGVLVIVSGIATVLLCVSISARQRLSVPPVAILLTGLAGVSLLQVLPLPVWLLDAMAPNNVAIWRFSLPPEAAAPGWMSISLAPPASVLVALRLWVYACVATSAALLTKQVGEQVCLGIIFVSTVVVAFVTLLHAALGLEAVYGVYTPRHATDTWPLGPLLNLNNLAGYMNLGVLIGIGFLASEDRVLPLWVVITGVLTNTVMSLLTASRAGVACLVLSTAAMCWTLWRRAAHRRSSEGRHTLRVVTASLALVVFGLTVGSSLATQGTWAGLFDKELEKFTLLARSTLLIRDHFWMGVGAGAFETTYPVYSVDPGYALSPSPENLVLDWLASWGVVIGGAALLSLAWQLFPARMANAVQAPAVFGAYIGILAVLAQNMLDLALDVAGVGIALFAAFGVLTATASIRVPTWRGPFLVIVGVAGAGAALGAGGLWFGRPSADQTRQALDRALHAGQPLDLALSMALRRYPADPYLPLLGSLYAMKQGRNPLPWVNRALSRDPRNPRVHLAAAHILRGRGATEQALLHLRHAAANDATLVKDAARLAVSWTHAHDGLTRAVPPGPHGPTMWLQIAQSLRGSGQESIKAFALQSAIKLDPNQPTPRSELLSLYLNALSQNSSLCAADRHGCLEQVDAQVRALLQLDPTHPSGVLGKARLLYHTQGPEAAETWLTERCDGLRERLGCHRLRLEYLTKSGKVSERKDAEERLRTACIGDSECGQAEVWIAQSRLSRGDPLGATIALQRATQLTPSRANWQLLAGAARRAGRKDVAQLAQTRADAFESRPVRTP